MAIERVQKIIAQAGLASRREAERWIKEGKVRINGQVASLGSKADLSKDAIKVNSRLLSRQGEKKVYLAFHKPKAVIAMTTPDPEGRPSIANFLKTQKIRLFPVGRMDFNGEGLMILTNDGEFSSNLQKSRKIVRRYQVKVKGHPTEAELEALKKGTRVEGRIVRPEFVKMVRRLTSKSLIDVLFVGMGTLDIRLLFQRKGFLVEKVSRTGIGEIRLGKIPPGGYKVLNGSQVKALLERPERALPRELSQPQNQDPTSARH